MDVYAAPDLRCSRCGEQLQMDSFGPFLYGWFMLVRHSAYRSWGVACPQESQRFFWNPEEHRERHA